MGLDDARGAVDAANAARPDLVVLLGDYVSRADAITRALVEVLRSLRAPLGVYAVLGNHDYWTDAPAMIRIFDDAGVRMLTNDHAVLTRDGQPLCLAGVDDLMAGSPSLTDALADAPDDAPRLLLCHNPDYLDRMPRDVRVDLALCGHTHGGQVRLPLIGPPALPVGNRRYAEGLVRAPSCPAYVSRGIGMVSIPVRFNCRPELPVITLHSA
ncbi:MAG: metallophosphoesterase, partial [Phycisphaerae bacterium]|nr:metallophosphoesterase [Phycisphaerae bacterium]